MQYQGRTFSPRALAGEVVLGITVEKEESKTYHPVVYFKRNNGEILMEHMEQFITSNEKLGYRVTKHLQEAEADGLA